MGVRNLRIGRSFLRPRPPAKPYDDDMKGNSTSAPLLARARQVTAPVFMLGSLLGLACSVEQPVSGPITLAGEWRTITPPEPLRVGGKLEQRLCLDIGTTRDVDFEKGVVVLDNGQRHSLEGEVVDDRGTAHTLRLAEQGRVVCLSRAAIKPNTPDFPANLTIIRVRLRSEPALQVAEVRWHSYDPH